MKLKLPTSIIFLLLAVLVLPVTSMAQIGLSGIVGRVWNDANGDGLYAGSETGIPAIVVELYSASDFSVIRSGLTDMTGVYSFPLPEAGDYFIQFTYPIAGFNTVSKRVGSDNTINSSTDNSGATDIFTVSGGNGLIQDYSLGLVNQTNKVTLCNVTFPETPVWTKTLDFPLAYSVPGYISGDLKNVSWFASGHSRHPSIGLENLDDDPVNPTISVGSTTNVSSAPGVGAFNYPTSFSTEVTLGPSDGVDDWAGPGGYSLTDKFTNGATQTQTVATPFVSNYATTGTVSRTFTGNTVFSVIGGANLRSNVTTESRGGGCITYTYDELALPVKLVDFSVTREGQMSLLSWRTIAEDLSSGFYVERSGDGKKWVSVGFVPSTATNGSSSTKIQYTFVDRSPVNGKNYYRLKPTDLDGTFTYSTIKVITMNVEDAIVLFPNPAKDRLVIRGLVGTEKIEIYDLTGRKVKEINPGDSVADLSLSRLSDGVYNVRIITPTGSSSYKIVKTK